MKYSSKITPIGAVLLLVAANSQADGLYAGVDGGGAFQQDTTIKNSTGFGGVPGHVKFNTGFRAGLDMGYEFNKYFSAEFDGSVIYNDINTIGTQPLSMTSPGGKAHLGEAPLLINGIFTWPLGRFKPYVGVGIGPAIGFFDSYNVVGSYLPGQNPSYKDSDLTFAYQLQAGFKFSVTEHIDLGVGYKFVGTTEHEWTDNSVTLKTDGTMTHSILGTFTYRF
ncbi:MAG TPA: outer membrane beta-barrel protein [Verrucomicrobiae bacterium]|jgi:opacity protein-like surface antigen